jgi:hypothetical protein
VQNGDLDGEVGLDVKWTPFANAAVDATLNPDFSQIESDVAQIGANERFALFFPEKRPFFLEGVELLRTPVQAVYTRTVTSPRFGLRTTGKRGGWSYTALAADDRGGGSVIIPGPNGSELADQDFHSVVAIGRVRRDFGRSFVSLLASAREIDGAAYNRLIGPDVQWRHGDGDTVTGQYLMSWSRTPDLPDLATEWDGRTLDGHAADASWFHNRTHLDWFVQYKDFGDGFRADNGFVPQVGYRQQYAESGWTVRPAKGLVRRLRSYFIFDRSEDRDGDLLNREYSPGVGLDAIGNTFLRLRWSFNRVRAGDGKVTLPRSRLVYVVNTRPSRFLSDVYAEGSVGSEVDFDNVRTGWGAGLVLAVTLRPTDHLELRFDNGRRFLDVDVPGTNDRPRLFTAKVDRLRATYNFTGRSFFRAIVQYVSTTRDPSLYVEAVDRRTAEFAASFLFAYKLNWQTVFFAGYGDDQELTATEDWARSRRQFFVKVSYAFQR